MGALVAVEARTKADLNKMVRFMRKQFRTDKIVMPWLSAERGAMPPPRVGKDLASYAKKSQIGYYFSAGYEYVSRDYANALVRWMALKIGKTMVYKPLDMRLPYYCYESDPVPLVPPTPYEVAGDDRDCEVLDHPLGYKRSHCVTPELLAMWEADNSINAYMLRSVHERMRGEPLILEELERLDRLW